MLEVALDLGLGTGLTRFSAGSIDVDAVPAGSFVPREDIAPGEFRPANLVRKVSVWVGW